MIIDILFLIVAGWGFYQGFTKGIIKTFFTIFSILFGLVVAFKLSPAATRFLETAFNTESAFTFVAGFLMVFLLTMIVIRLLAKFVESALQSANINFINQVIGGIVLGALYTLMLSYLIWFADASHIIKEKTKTESMTYTQLKEFPSKMKSVYEFVKPAFRDFWNESIRFMDKLEEQNLEQTDSQHTIFDVPDENSTQNSSGQ
ncbi:MAG: hypothetical protein CMN32_02525 [Saprospirales bacterium]|jgi:membrane protein required for colicin V production|nr:hypothetical protein [Saprospirales bacterium]